MKRRPDVASQAWRHLFDFLIATGVHRSSVLARLGLTPNDAKALNSLDADNGQPMSTLAARWGTDASTATWTVDRLERRGLAERRPDPGDRRVKLVALTPAGVETQQELANAFYQPPPELLEFDDADLATLLAIFERRASRKGPAKS